MNRTNNIKTMTDNKDEKKYSIHVVRYWNLGWIIAILVFIAILLATCKLDAIACPNLITGLTNFATLLSIILSISSILFAYFTSQNTSRHFDDMSTMLAEVKEINNSIKSNNEMLINMVHQMSLSVQSIDTKTQINGTFSNQSNMQPGSNINSNDISNMINDKQLSSDSKTGITNVVR